MYTNDSKPSGSYNDDSNLNKVRWGDPFYTWGSSSALWGNASLYTDDSKPSGSYSNDTKPT